MVAIFEQTPLVLDLEILLQLRAGFGFLNADFMAALEHMVHQHGIYAAILIIRPNGDEVEIQRIVFAQRAQNVDEAEGEHVTIVLFDGGGHAGRSHAEGDHVVVFEDELKEIAKEIIRNNADQRVLIGLDYFDASINRVMAWVTGMRNMQKALLWALLLPNEETTKLQDEARFTELMYLNEKMKTYPFGDVWEEYLKRNGVKSEFLTDIKDYEKELNNRK